MTSALGATVARLYDLGQDIGRFAASFEAAMRACDDPEIKSALSRFHSVFNDFAMGIRSIDASLPERLRRELGIPRA